MAVLVLPLLIWSYVTYWNVLLANLTLRVRGNPSLSC